MTPGPTLIMKAPGCKKPVKFFTIASGNNSGATSWTDGKLEAPMLRDDAWLRKSPSEGVLFWSDECEKLGQYHFNCWDHPEWQDLAYAQKPSEDDYVVALQSGIANTPEKERYLRMRLWWCRNDIFRRGKQSSFSRAHRANLERFAEILSEEDDNQRLMKAEVLRHLSRFDEVLRLLEGDFPEKYSRIVVKIRELAHQSKASVAKIE